jgi:L-lactate permease
MKKITAIFTISLIVFVTVAITVFDIWAISKGGTEASISHLIFEWSYKYPMLNHLAGLIEGILIGHLFWRIRDTATTKKISDSTRE